MTDQHQQQGILQISFRDLARLLNLPEGHQIERINLTQMPYAPGLLITISGEAMPFAIPGGALAIEDYQRFIETAAERVEAARRHRKGSVP